MEDWIIHLVDATGYWGVALLMLLETVFPPIPSEVIMTVAGVSAARGNMSLAGTIAAGTAGAMLGKSRVEAARIETQREQIEQAVQVAVRSALQAIRTSEARLRAAAVARENSAKQYESEQRKLDAGQSDIYKVLERQTALAAARSNELRARTELNKAIAELQRATGNSLKAKNIEPK